MRLISETIWLNAGYTKSANCISATGRRPYTAAPIAAPAIIPSVSGVSRTRLSPYFAQRPSVAPKTPPFLPTSSPRTMTRSSRSISSSSPWRIASRMFSSAISVAALVAERLQRDRGSTAGDRLRVDALVCVVGRRFGTRLRALAGVVDLALHVGADLRIELLGEHPRRAKLRREHRNWVSLLERVDPGRIAVAPLVVV